MENRNPLTKLTLPFAVLLTLRAAHNVLMGGAAP